MVLDGTIGGYVSVDNELNLSGATSFSWWFNAQQNPINGAFPIVRKERQFYIDLGNGRIRVNLFDTTNQLIQNESDFASEIALGRQCNFYPTQNQWYHFVVTYDGGKTHDGINFYVDGVKQTSVGFHNTGPSEMFDSFNTNSDEIFEIGSRLNYYSIQQYHGHPDGTLLPLNMHRAMLLDDISIFNSELTESNVATLYNNGRPGDISSLNPFCWWKMNQGDVENEIENDGTSNIPAKLEGSAKFYPLINNYNLSLDGEDGYASTELSVAGASSLTVSAWVKLDSTSETRGFVSQYVGGGNRTFRLAYFPSLQSMWFEVYGPDSYAGFKDVNLLADTWYHVVGVYDGTDTVCYVNGVASTTTSGLHASGTGNLDSCTDNINIGRMANADYMKGYIDEVGIWTSALSASDINSIFNEGVPSYLPHSPLAWYRMGDNDGGVGDIITDQGSGGNNATLQGSAKIYPPTSN